MAGILNSMARAPELREVVNPKHPRDPALAAMFAEHGAGPAVTPDSAMRVTAVYAAVSLIAETLAALPLHVMRRTAGDNGNESAKATDHPLYRVLHDMPANGITSYEWREMMFTHTALRGDSFARIVLDGAGRVLELPPILPDHIRPERNRLGRPQFRWWPDGSGPSRVLFDDEVLRIPHKMLDGLHSLSPIATHRMTIGNALASSQFLQGFYANSAQPKGALISQEPLTKEAAKAMRESWEERHQGPQNAGRIAIFDGGLKWEAIGMTMDDAQYIELQKFSVSDIARIFLIPPHKIGDLSNATFSNIEHQAIEFVVDTILRWVRRAEMRFNAYLLSGREREAGYYIAFDLKGLLRGDATSRSNFYRALFYIGAINPNEIRALEDMNPYEGGENFFVQGATVPIDQLMNTPQGQGIREMVDRAITDAVSRIEEERRVKA